MPKGKHVLGLQGGKHIFGTVKVGEKGQIVIHKDARSLFGIQSGDALLVLGDERGGLIVTRPDVIRETANQIFDRMEKDS